MIFVDYLGSAERFAAVAPLVAKQVASVLRTPEASVHVRRMVTEGDGPNIEVWIELSSEEQLYRLGRTIAQQVTEAVKPEVQGDVWVMFRIVPLNRAFLNGEPRSRGTSTLE
jgi:hypothetical protein